MRTEIEALKEIRDRISNFCARLDGKYDPPWAQEVVGIIDDVLITPYRQCKRFGAPFYVEVGTSIVAIRCASNHDVVWRADHSVHGKATVDWAESVCTRMNQEAHKRERGDCAKLREALLQVIRSMELESGHMCTEKKRLGMHGQTQEDLCKGCRARNAECWTMTLKRECEAALAEKPRNCDVYTADELKVIFKSELVSELPIANEHEKNLITITAMRVIDTLFATAEEGGKNAYK